MKRTKNQLVMFKVEQAVGSMAIENIQVSRSSKATMLRVARGSVSASAAIDAVVEKYSRSPEAAAD